MSSCYLYAIGPENNGPIKIGFSKNPKRRIKSLQTSHPETLVIHCVVEFETDKAKYLERFIHRDINYKRTKGEWFDMSPEDAKGTLEFFRIHYEDKSLNEIKLLTK
jgi:hypothetical protein